jgi:hypothetical protein
MHQCATKPPFDALEVYSNHTRTISGTLFSGKFRQKGIAITETNASSMSNRLATFGDGNNHMDVAIVFFFDILKVTSM